MMTVRGRLPRFGAIVLVVVAGLLVACGEEEAPRVGGERAEGGAERPPTFVTAVPDSEFFLAISRSGDEVIAYVCGGGDTAEWFEGVVQDDRLELTSESGAATVSATLSADAAEGTLSIEGRSLEFRAAPATGNAGLYRAEGTVRGDPFLAGWIVLPEGDQEGSFIFEQPMGLPRMILRAPMLTVFTEFGSTGIVGA